MVTVFTFFFWWVFLSEGWKGFTLMDFIFIILKSTGTVMILMTEEEKGTKSRATSQGIKVPVCVCLVDGLIGQFSFCKVIQKSALCLWWISEQLTIDTWIVNWSLINIRAPSGPRRSCSSSLSCWMKRELSVGDRTKWGSLHFRFKTVLCFFFICLFFNILFMV